MLVYWIHIVLGLGVFWTLGYFGFELSAKNQILYFIWLIGAMIYRRVLEISDKPTGEQK